MSRTPQLIKKILITCLAAHALLISAAHAQLRIEISGVGNRQIPIAIANFSGNSGLTQDIAKIVRDDLALSGLFRNIDASTIAYSDTNNLNLADWKARGADAVVAGTITRMNDGRYDVRFKLYDSVKREDLGGLQLASLPSNLRLSAHNIADYIYEKLLGEPGLFATQIAYVLKQGRQRYELQVADMDGQNAQSALISKEPIISPAWSPDGTRLAYVSFELRKPVIYVHTLATGQRVPVANFKGSNSAPAWSPDGKQLAVVLSRDGHSQIYLMNVDGSNLRRLIQSPGIDTEPRFAPDGLSIFFTSDRGGSPQIYRAAINGGEATRITFKGDYNISPRISPDGKTLAYIARRAGRFQLMALDLASGQELALTDTSKDESPSFSPNGKMILYATELNGQDVLAAVSPDGQIKQRLTTLQGGEIREPTWRPYIYSINKIGN